MALLRSVTPLILCSWRALPEEHHSMAGNRQPLKSQQHVTALAGCPALLYFGRKPHCPPKSETVVGSALLCYARPPRTAAEHLPYQDSMLNMA